MLVWLPLFPAHTETIDDDPEAVSLYARGKRLEREADWLGAARQFEELAGRFPGSPNLDLFVFNRAKSYYHFGDYGNATAGFTNFLSRFPESFLGAYARYFLANMAYARGNADLAVSDYIDAFADSRDSRLDDLIVTALQAAITNATQVRLSPSDFAGVPSDRRCALITPLVETLRAQQHFATANRLGAACGQAVVAGAATGPSMAQELTLAMLLPFSGELQSFGEDLYNGAVIAAELYREETKGNLVLDPYDSQGDPVTAARIVRQLQDSPADVIIGPLTSTEAMVASAALACDPIPLIAPAATEAGLTRLSECSFQLSPNVELQGVVMAEYAVLQLGADSAAILTSTAPEHLRMARAFTDRFTELGGTMVAVQYYRSRDKDFGPIVRDIKGMILGVQPDSVYFIDENADTLDFDVVPVHIDCLFMPGTSSQLRLLLPQVHFYNLNAVWLGSDGWGDQSVYSLEDRIVGGSVFPSPFLESDLSEETIKFTALYDTRFGERPNRLAKLGYDAVRLATGAVRAGGATRQQLIDRLAKVSDWQGAAGTVSFGKARENVAMPLYRIENQAATFIGYAGKLMLSPNASPDTTEPPEPDSQESPQ